MVSLSALRGLEDEYRDKRCAQHPDGRLSVLAGQGIAMVFCPACKSAPAAFTEVLSPTKAYRQGRALPAAVAHHVERRLGVTTESKALVERAAAAPPSRLPNDQEVKEILSVFHGWEKDRDGKPLAPGRPTAVILWKLMQMGFSPQDVNLLGGKPYINTDGMASHAQRLLAAQGRRYGIEYMVQHRFVTDKTELTMVGAKQGDTTIAFEFLVPSPVKTTYADGRIEERVEWKVVATEYGRGNGTPGQTVIKVAGKYDQPVELQHPQRMAWVRADRHGWKLVAPVTLPSGVGYFDPAINAALEPEVIEGTSRTLEAPSLPASDPGEAPSHERDATADTVAAAPPEAPEATQEAAANVLPGGQSSVASAGQPEASPVVPEVKPGQVASLTLAVVRADAKRVQEIKQALGAAGVSKQAVQDYGYGLQLGVDAVLQLAADGYSTEQIVAIVSGKAQPSLGW